MSSAPSAQDFGRDTRWLAQALEGLTMKPETITLLQLVQNQLLRHWAKRLNAGLMQFRDVKCLDGQPASKVYELRSRL